MKTREVRKRTAQCCELSEYTGILFWDNINEYNLLSEYIKNGEFEYAGVNPLAN